ncbi:dual specificity phosphatase [Angomonas deanei]|uniref:Dual specificity phosphatase, catalytic domain/Inositol hexakisphosphate/AAA domain/RNA ligase, putative n=1 Tax=Angomonas deanei TaxID=59799 RepID=A0A7G2CP22_9TRYP|nr:dual specificity phosphatase [Angomonas deanei]CAD2220857.1 Dual specificity phosphatase, catalytic domain/Inositol hexakisphosphate/AAA domain/RNA ligase, putative [Angomonas deanei]|eukprot:EPY21620.1 dual specificity phosphatase [Angomonas deanei]
MAATLLAEAEQLPAPTGREDMPYYCIGLVKTEEVCFVPVLFPLGQTVRLQCGLCERPGLHITLGFRSHDVHDMDKSFRSLKGNRKHLCETEVRRFLKDCLKVLERQNSKLDGGDTPFEEIDDVSKSFIAYLYDVLQITDMEDLFRLYLALFCKDREERRRLLYAMVHAGHCGVGLLALLRLQEDPAALFALMEEAAGQSNEQYPGRRLIVGCNQKQAEAICDFYNTHRHVDESKSYAMVLADSADSAKVELIRAPSNFCEIPIQWGERKLYGSGIVQKKHLPLLQQLGITTVVNLMEQSGSSLSQSTELCYHHIPVDDQNPPSEEQMGKILELLSPDANPTGNVVVHCLGGKGRTAVVLLLCLMKYGRTSLSEGYGVLDSTGRCTILTEKQKEALRAWEQSHDVPVPENTAEEEEGVAPPEDAGTAVDYSSKLRCDAIVMCGLPGSGKSTLAKHIAQHCSRVVRISQDELGRKEAEKRLSAVGGGKIALIDRCSLTPEDRAEWRPARAQRVLCIFLNTPPEAAIFRVKNRKDHETLRATAAERVIKELQAKLIPPDAEKEGFCQVLTLSSEEAVQHAVTTVWGMPPLEAPALDTPTIVKFPRTRHLINLGAATRDDLVLDRHDLDHFLRTPIYVEEKIDGANFGISIDPTTYQIVCQNRSHVVSSGYHPQFGKLTPWLAEHSAELYQLLVPGREVLYGEWLVAQHSIHYTKLPDYFIAFDLFDKFTNTFASRPVLEQRLQECTTIPVIRLIAHRTFEDKAQLAALVNTVSDYYDGKVEGVYLRICEGDVTLDRAKIVRNDFIAGNDHWTKKQMVTNIVVKEW